MIPTVVVLGLFLCFLFLFSYDVWIRYRSCWVVGFGLLGFSRRQEYPPFLSLFGSNFGWLYRLYKRQYRPHTHAIYFTFLLPTRTLHFRALRQQFTLGNTSVSFFFKPVKAKSLSISNIFHNKNKTIFPEGIYRTKRTSKQADKQTKSETMQAAYLTHSCCCACTRYNGRHVAPSPVASPAAVAQRVHVTLVVDAHVVVAVGGSVVVAVATARRLTRAAVIAVNVAGLCRR